MQVSVARVKENAQVQLQAAELIHWPGEERLGIQERALMFGGGCNDFAFELLNGNSVQIRENE